MSPALDQVDVRAFPLAILYDFEYPQFHYLVQVVDDLWFGNFSFRGHFVQVGSDVETLLVIFDVVSCWPFVHGSRLSRM